MKWKMTDKADTNKNKCIFPLWSLKGRGSNKKINSSKINADILFIYYLFIYLLLSLELAK